MKKAGTPAQSAARARRPALHPRRAPHRQRAEAEAGEQLAEARAREDAPSRRGRRRRPRPSAATNDRPELQREPAADQPADAPRRRTRRRASPAPTAAPEGSVPLPPENGVRVRLQVDAARHVARLVERVDGGVEERRGRRAASSVGRPAEGALVGGGGGAGGHERDGEQQERGPGDPEPRGEAVHGRVFWHGWSNGAPVMPLSGCRRGSRSASTRRHARRLALAPRGGVGRALRFPKRRSEFRLGRWTAKKALALYLGRGRSADALRDDRDRPRARRRARSARRRPAGRGLHHDDRPRRPGGLPRGPARHRPRLRPRARRAAQRRLRRRLPDAGRAGGSWPRPATASATSSPTSSGAARSRRSRCCARACAATRAASRCRFPQAPTVDGWAPMSVRAVEGAVFPGWWQRFGAFVLTVAATEPFDAAAAARRPARPRHRRPRGLLAWSAAASLMSAPSPAGRRRTARRGRRVPRERRACSTSVPVVIRSPR